MLKCFFTPKYRLQEPFDTKDYIFEHGDNSHTYRWSHFRKTLKPDFQICSTHKGLPIFFNLPCSRQAAWFATIEQQKHHRQLQANCQGHSQVYSDWKRVLNYVPGAPGS